MARSKRVVKSSRGFIPQNRKKERKQLMEYNDTIANIAVHAEQIASSIATENARRHAKAEAIAECEDTHLPPDTDILYWINYKHTFDPHDVRYLEMEMDVEMNASTSIFFFLTIAKRIGAVVKKCEPEAPWTDIFIQYICLEIDDAVDLYMQIIGKLPKQSHLYHLLMYNKTHISRTSDFIEESTLTTYTNMYYAHYLYKQLCDLYVIIDVWNRFLPNV
jgi:hypothetical protein